MLFCSLAPPDLTMSNTPSILLTGASGLVGSHVLNALIDKGFHARLLSRNPERDQELIRPLLAYYGKTTAELDFVTGDLCDLGSLEDALQGINTVIHAAALVSVEPRERERMYKTNVEGTANLVNLSLDMGISWFCHVSSVATLGPNPEGLVDEDYFLKQQKTSTAYAISKYQAEQEVWRGKEEGLPVMVVNPSFVVGPGLRNSSSNRLFHALERGLPGILNGETGYVDARDLAEVIVQLMLDKSTDYRLIINSENHSTTHFVGEICSKLNRKAPRLIRSQSLLNLALFFASIQRLFGIPGSTLTRDLIRMSTSRNRYSNQLSIEKLGICYRSISEAIDNTLKFRKSTSLQ